MGLTTLTLSDDGKMAQIDVVLFGIEYTNRNQGALHLEMYPVVNVYRFRVMGEMKGAKRVYRGTHNIRFRPDVVLATTWIADALGAADLRALAQLLTQCVGEVAPDCREVKPSHIIFASDPPKEILNIPSLIGEMASKGDSQNA